MICVVSILIDEMLCGISAIFPEHGIQSRTHMPAYSLFLVFLAEPDLFFASIYELAIFVVFCGSLERMRLQVDFSSNFR